MNKKILASTVLVAIVALGSVYAAGRSDIVNRETLVRIKPVGEVRVAKAGEVLKSLSVKPIVVKQEKAKPAKPLTMAERGEQVYQKSCSACHAPGIAGAPKFGDATSWKPHIDKGMDVLILHAKKGFRAMPPKGTCMTCTDEDLKAAVHYMIDHSKG